MLTTLVRRRHDEVDPPSQNMPRMKTLLSLILALGVTSKCADADTLSVEDVARHLHISGWDSLVDLPPGSFSVALMQIIDGKVRGTVLGGLKGPKEDPTGQRIVVMVSPGPTGSDATLAVGRTSTYNSQKKMANIQDFQVLPLPKQIREGDYVLGGAYQLKDGTTTISGKMEDIRNGLLLRVSK